MHSFDPDRIAALAEGTLTPVDAAALEAQIAADPAAAADLVAQRAALEAIRGARPRRLDERERVALHAAVATQLGLTGSSAPVPMQRRHLAWGPIAVAATTLVAVIAFAPMVSDLGGGDADGDTAAVAETATTVASGEGFEAVPLGTQLPEPTATAGDAGDDRGTAEATTTVAGMLDRAAYLPAVADDLALLKSDPEALTVLGRPVEDTTPCRAEATEYFGSADLTTFDYPVANSDPMLEPTTYVVFLLPAPDGVGGGERTLVAFDPVDCATPIVVP